MLDLTPFGFTQTESAVYEGLLELGPSSGYAVAKHLSVARANTYQALDALVAKGAATVSGTPKVYRGVAPEGLLALITRDESAKLDRLEKDLARLEQLGEPATLHFAGERRLEELVLRTAARAQSVRCVGPEPLVRRLVPIWRKREQDGSPTEIRTIGPTPDSFPVRLEGRAPGAAKYFDGDPFILLTDSAGIAAISSKEDLSGLWTSEPLLRGLISAALDTLASSPQIR